VRVGESKIIRCQAEAGRIIEAPDRLGAREPLDEVAAEGFLPAMQRPFGGEEKGGGLNFR
jgi:hypothetical protein